MIRPDQIPDEVVEAALKKRGLMREAIADALNAWPGMWAEGCTTPHLIIPLPTSPAGHGGSTEASDKKPRRTLDEMRGVFAEAYKSNRNASDE